MVAVVFALAMVWKGIDYLTMSSEECAAIAHHGRFESECLSEAELRQTEARDLESPDTRGWLALGMGVTLILIVGVSVVHDANRSDELDRERAVGTVAPPGDQPRPSVP